MQGGRGRPIAPSCRVSEGASLFRALCRFKEQTAFVHAAAESYLPGIPVSGKRASRKSKLVLCSAVRTARLVGYTGLPQGRELPILAVRFIRLIKKQPVAEGGLATGCFQPYFTQ